MVFNFAIDQVRTVTRRYNYEVEADTMEQAMVLMDAEFKDPQMEDEGFVKFTESELLSDGPENETDTQPGEMFNTTKELIYRAQNGGSVILNNALHPSNRINLPTIDADKL